MLLTLKGEEACFWLKAVYVPLRRTDSGSAAACNATESSQRIQLWLNPEQIQQHQDLVLASNLLGCANATLTGLTPFCSGICGVLPEITKLQKRCIINKFSKNDFPRPYAHDNAVSKTQHVRCSALKKLVWKPVSCHSASSWCLLWSIPFLIATIVTKLWTGFSFFQ